MFAGLVCPQNLEHRLDAGYYDSKHLAIRDLLESLGAKRLRNLVSKIACGPFGGNAIADDLYQEDGLMFIRPINISSNRFDDSSLVKVPENILMENGLKVYQGENLYFGRVGVPCVALISGKTSISPNIIIAETKNISADPYYLFSFSSSSYGLSQLKRQLKEVAQPTTSTDAVKDLLVYEPHLTVQAYIGNKVRHAELLSQHAREVKLKLDSFFGEFEVEQEQEKIIYSNTSPELLTNILTATTYKQKYILNQENIKTLGKTKKILDYLNSISNGFDERTDVTDGLPYVKVADVRPNSIDLFNCGRVRKSALTDASKKQTPEKGDLLLTRKGSFGIAAVVMSNQEFLCSSEVFCCKPKRHDLMPILSWFLNHKAGQLQFWQFSTGTTMPGINQENLNNIFIPDFSDWDIDGFNYHYNVYYNSFSNAEKLILTSRFLVEALIEGVITQDEIIEAQQALESDDNTKDKAILSKLTEKGYAIEDAKPLFSNLEELYEILEEAQQEKEQG
ncbi:restriction endonuclease subunit S [Vibrio mexicanus]|uniref:restriction endonuclease subunit S n=1 Tax=Vibrio mexicanus TaxID=1004326 RepID=UPI00063C67DE|nr:restriction endonuclease subunit S [Vibrio mexicanus]